MYIATCWLTLSELDAVDRGTETPRKVASTVHIMTDAKQGVYSPHTNVGLSQNNHCCDQHMRGA